MKLNRGVVFACVALAAQVAAAQTADEVAAVRWS